MNIPRTPWIPKLDKIISGQICDGIRLMPLHDAGDGLCGIDPPKDFSCTCESVADRTLEKSFASTPISMLCSARASLRIPHA